MTTFAPGWRRAKARRFCGAGGAHALGRLVVVAGRGQAAVLAREKLDERQARQVEVLVVVDEHVREALGDARADLRALLEQARARAAAGRPRRARRPRRACARGVR